MNIEQFSQELNIELSEIVNNFNVNLELKAQKLIADITDMINNIEKEFCKIA